MASSENPPVAIIDTNILMALPHIDQFNWGVPVIHLYVLYSVMDELCGLMRDKIDLQKAKDAETAWKILDPLLKRMVPGGLPLQGGKSRLFFVPAPEEVQPPLDAWNVDHQQIAFAQSLVRKDPQRFCAVVTRDQEMAELVSAAIPGVQVIVPGSYSLDESLRLQFSRRYAFWQQWQPNPAFLKAETQPSPAQSIKPARPPISTNPDPGKRLQRVVRSFYSRIKASHHRAILTIAPSQARLALTAHLIALYERTPRRVVLVIVESAAAAAYWAAELRVRSGLSPRKVLIFKEHNLPLKDLPRVVVFCHDQVETHFRQFAAWLKEEQRRITVVVDGCHLLAPETLALLLLEDQQFIGFTRYARPQVKARSNHTLGYFFKQQSLLNYTFADAEEDGWLRAFDLIRQPISWLPEESQEFNLANAQYIQSHNEILKTFPALGRSLDFWTALQDLLETVSDTSVAGLLELRERREEMAQIAHNKLERMLSLLAADGDVSGRSLVYDPSGLWIPVLQNILPRHKLSVRTGGNTTPPEEWDYIWRRFEAGRLDALLLGAIPPFGLIRANVHRLVITTPLTSLASLASVTDWTLSHTHPQGRHPVEIHLLYVPNTPEEENMLDYADTVCGLQFTL